MKFELENIVPEEQGDYGLYFTDELRESPTQKLSYSWGTDKQKIRTAYLQPAIFGLIRRIKETGKIPSQKKAMQIAAEEIKIYNDQFNQFGDDMHQAFKAANLGQEAQLPTPRHEAFFEGFKYFNRQHEIKPILIEQFLSCPHCTFTCQVDLFAEVDGKNTVIDYKTGWQIGPNTEYQLAIYKHVLEHLGYRVDQTWAVHVAEFFAYPLPLCRPWEDVELRLKNADLKIDTLRPKIFIREKSGEKKKADSITPSTSEEQELVPAQDAQGHQFPQEDVEFSPTTAPKQFELLERLVRTYLGPAGKQLPETDVELSPIAVPIQKRHRGRPRKDPSASTSGHRKATRPQNRFSTEELSPSAVRRALHAKRRKVQVA